MNEFETRSFFSKNGQEVVLREALPGDASGLLGYLEDLFRDSPYILMTSEDFSLGVEEEARFLESLLEHETSLMLLAVHDGVIVGNLDIRGSSRRRDRHRVQMGMSVHPQWRGQGIGRALLQAAVDYCVAHPLIRKFELGVIEQNSKALALYESFGFREEGRSKRGFFSDDKKYLDEILMGLWTES